MISNPTLDIAISSMEWIWVSSLVLIVVILAGILLKLLPKNNRQAPLDRVTNEFWHDIPAEVLDTLNSSVDGLSMPEVFHRQQNYGLNLLPQAKSQPSLIRFLIQFHNILIYVLVVAAVTTAILGHWLDASVIGGVIVINAVIGFVQEGKAENSLKAIRHMLSVNAMVIREKKQMTVPAEELVPGDIVLLQSGAKVPADLRLLKVKGLQIQESVLTGESLAIDKSIEPVATATVLADRHCMAYSSTLVTHGQGAGVVVATGAQTELGHISKMVAEVETVTTPLLRQMAQFSRYLTLAILVVALITFAFGVLFRDYAIAQMFLAAVSLAVAAIPEGLPAIMTITLAIGVQRMARRNAVIRKLPAVETLGAVTVICSDKTGTLTRNEMTVDETATSTNIYQLTGTGYDPLGSILLQNKTLQTDEHPLLLEAYRAAILCNDTSLEQTNNQWRVHGDPMEGALLIAGLKAGINIEKENKQNPRIDLIPFESEQRFMATLHQTETAGKVIYLKGAPEVLLDMCDFQKTTNSDIALDKDYWLARIEQMTNRGQRVLAIATKTVKNHQATLNNNDVENGFSMLAMFGLIDPPREEAIKAIESCHQAGIRVIMITGDHAGTARAIARQLLLGNITNVITGRDIDLMSLDELKSKVEKVDIYARVNPEHKILLVRLLQEQGLIVAMTGDGVNDAPALKRADVGTAMGQNGTEAAKEAAEMVLLDDNFASITHAIEEGRTVHDNLKKSILFILPTNGGEALIILAAILFGFTQLPLIPVQILWVNMVTTVTLALSLAFEPAEHDVMQRPPRNAKEPMLTKHLIWRVIFVSFIMMIGTFGLFLWEMNRGVSIEHARTVAVNTLVLFEIFYLFNSRYISAPVLNWKGLTGNLSVLFAIALLIVLQLGFTYFKPLQTLFGTTSLDPVIWIRIIIVSSSVLFLIELEKFLLKRRISTTA